MQTNPTAVQIASILLSLALCSELAHSAAMQIEPEPTLFPLPGPSSRPYTIAPGPDGNVWFTETMGNRIGRITPSGVITEFTVPTSGSTPYGIATGPDGNLWFTERLGNKIGVLTPSGVFTEHAIPTPFAQPWEITAGPDGNLWFTEEDVNQIGRITPQGVVSEFSVPQGEFPTGITAGPDGNVWFTQEIGDFIGRVTPSGTITLFPIPSVQVLPWDIIPGPDGNLWFTELAGRAVGRISTAGALLELPIAGSFSGIAGIIALPGGDLWFTENDVDLLRRMTPTGSVKRTVTLAPAVRPLGITLGPDGNLWFAEADGNAIGRLAPGTRQAQTVLLLESGFSPAARDARLGLSIQWINAGARAHRIVDASGLGLFDSGNLGLAQGFSLRITVASTFPTLDVLDPTKTGEVGVQVALAARGFVGLPFPVVWALAPAPPGVFFDVQVELPGSGVFQDWMSATALVQAGYLPIATGVHRFRSRLRNPLTGFATLYSPPATIVVQ